MAQGGFHFTAWHTCSMGLHLNFPGTHPAESEALSTAPLHYYINVIYCITSWTNPFCLLHRAYIEWCAISPTLKLRGGVTGGCCNVHMSKWNNRWPPSSKSSFLNLMIPSIQLAIQNTIKYYWHFNEMPYLKSNMSHKNKLQLLLKMKLHFCGTIHIYIYIYTYYFVKENCCFITCRLNDTTYSTWEHAKAYITCTSTVTNISAHFDSSKQKLHWRSHQDVASFNNIIINQ